jgi:hypothetical protein
MQDALRGIEAKKMDTELKEVVVGRKRVECAKEALLYIEKGAIQNAIQSLQRIRM